MATASSQLQQGTAQGMNATADDTSKQARAAEELSSSISEISRRVTQSTEISNQAVVEIKGAKDKG